MSSLIRRAPVSDLMSLHTAMDRLFGETFGVSGQSRSVEITFDGGTITIKGEINEIKAPVPKAQPVKPKSVNIPISGATHSGNHERTARPFSPA